MNALPTLYKRDSKGKIQYWAINTAICLTNADSADIIVRHGKEGGKEQVTIDNVTQGKNLGKANETSAVQQADAEAQSKWTKQQERKGYVADKTLVDVDQRPGAEPMLAHRYDKYPDKITFPCFEQPKLDGHRCTAIVKEGKCKLFSRQRKPITGVPHIIEAIEALGLANITFDGELYNHDYKDKFEELTGFIRSKDPKEGYEVVQYHMYDLIDLEMPFEERNHNLEVILEGLEADTNTLKYVDTRLVNNDDEALTYFREFRNDGYEGAILRNKDSLYVGKRSYDLQKVKEFDDAEFLITDVKEGRGKMKGHAIFTCIVLDTDVDLVTNTVTAESQTFDVKMKGSMDKLKEIFENAEEYKGQFLTVMFQEYTKNGIPRFPVGLRLRKDA